jgi:RHH-type rel operon transcriptional repressor/antitoxin RelB
MNMLAIRLSPDIEKRLEELSRRTGRTKTYYAREAIAEHLDDLEDYYLAMNRLENPGRRWTMGEVEKEIGLAS